MQLTFYFDQSRCTGCETCVVACKDWHDLPAGSASLLLSHATFYGHPVSATYFDTLVAEVEVNEQTGEVNVLNLTVVCDCGKVINLTSLEGQIQGARGFGIGWALSEEQIYKEGRLLNSSY